MIYNKKRSDPHSLSPGYHLGQVTVYPRKTIVPLSNGLRLLWFSSQPQCNVISSFIVTFLYVHLSSLESDEVHVQCMSPDCEEQGETIDNLEQSRLH